MRRKMNAGEFDDLIYSKPEPLNEDILYTLIAGKRYKFNIGMYKEYLIEARNICEKALSVPELNLATSIEVLSEHLITSNNLIKSSSKQVYSNEFGFLSIFVMRLIQVSIELIKPKECTDILLELFKREKITK
mmetsp:Transcript_23759/g.23449  ORF Transcript_23759/g.23449 Transcript_23759/m.23449 type:complete len:133 (+) Transcript_23759:149-547(+)